MAMEVSWRTECSMGSNWEYPWNGQEPGYKSLQITQEPLEGNEHDSEAFLKACRAEIGEIRPLV